MTKHMITAALRDLDPAPETDLSGAERARADATFARILATSGEDPVPGEPAGPRRRRRRMLAPVGLAGAAAAVPAMLLAGGSAFASWTPTPEPLAAEAASSAASTCRARMHVSDQAARVLVAERRGGWTYVLISGPEEEAACLMPNDLVGQDPSDGDADMFGHGGVKDWEDSTPARDRIDETSSGSGSTAQGWFTTGWFNYAEGYVGSKVTGVTVHTSSGHDVEASVDGGRFAAWWPGVQQSSDNPDGETWTYTVTLADGSSRRTTG